MKTESLRRIRQELDEIEAARAMAHENVRRAMDLPIMSHEEAKRVLHAMETTTTLIDLPIGERDENGRLLSATQLMRRMRGEE